MDFIIDNECFNKAGEIEISNLVQEECELKDKVLEASERILSLDFIFKSQYFYK
jgi:hypothetical protein